MCDYDDMILEVLWALQDPKFKTNFGLKLNHLVSQENITKIYNKYKLKDMTELRAAVWGPLNPNAKDFLHTTVI